jgi:hypothetical protein
MPVVTANGSRPDVGAALPGIGAGHGFSWSTTVAPGEHRVCLYAIDADLPWRNTLLGCRGVTLSPGVIAWSSATGAWGLGDTVTQAWARRAPRTAR